MTTFTIDNVTAAHAKKANTPEAASLLATVKADWLAVNEGQRWKSAVPTGEVREFGGYLLVKFNNNRSWGNKYSFRAYKDGKWAGTYASLLTAVRDITQWHQPLRSAA